MKLHTSELAISLNVTTRTIGRWKRSGLPVFDTMWLTNPVGFPADYDVYETDDVIDWLKSSGHFAELHRAYVKDCEPLTLEQYERQLRGFYEGLHYAVDCLTMDGMDNSDMGRLVEIQHALRDMDD